MTNQYFNHENPLDRHTLGRAELVNAIFEAVVAGFDKLPNPDLINQAAQTYADDTGAANAYVVSLPKAPQAYTAGLTITMRAANANTGASTINVDGLGAKTIKRYSGDPLIAGDILVGQLVVLGYDGTDFRLVGVHGGEVELARQWATSLTTVGSGMKGSRGYAQDAAASAGAAKDSEDAALLSEQNTEALYVDFRKRYYGQYASDPATDPLGNAPQGGALYYNTTAKEMRIYDEDDDSWSAIGMGTLQTFVFTAAGGETSLSGLDDNNRALNYSPGFELVYLNGARLVPGDDYVASNGSTITGLTALSPGDVVTMDAFTRFSLTEERLSLINNIAVLRLKSGAAGFDRAWLKCHTTDGDGGHGSFRWASGAPPGTYVDNNGTIIVPTGGDGSAAWLRDYSGAVNVRWFGAKGDGLTVDSANIQSALDTGAGDVYVPDGTYMIDAVSSALEPQSNQRLILSQGAELKAIANSSAGYRVIKIESKTRVRIEGGKITGERNDHTGVGGEAGMCVEVRASTYIDILGVTISDGWGDGIYLGSDNDVDRTKCENVTIRDCVIRNNRRNNISVINCENLIIEGCLIAEANGTASQFGIDLEPNNDVEDIVNTKIVNCTFIDNTGGGVATAGPVGGCKGLFIDGCYFIGNNYGVYSNFEDTIVSNCIISGSTGTTNYVGGITLSKGVAIGNTVRDCVRSAFGAYAGTSSDDVVFKHNISSGCQTDYYLESPANIYIHGNIGVAKFNNVRTASAASRLDIDGNTFSLSEYGGTNYHLRVGVGAVANEARITNNKFLTVSGVTNTQNSAVLNPSTIYLVAGNDWNGWGDATPIFTDGATVNYGWGNRDTDGVWKTTAL